MLSPVRWFIGILLLLALVLTVAWRSTDTIANYVARGQLAALDFELVNLRLLPLRPSGLSLPALHLTSATMDVEVTALELLPLPDAGLQLVVENVRIELLASESEGPEPELGALWQQLQSALPALPRQGFINQISVCQNNFCESATLAWNRNGEGIRLDAVLSGQGIQLHADLGDAIQVEAVFTNEGQRAIGEWRVEPSADLFLVSAKGLGLPNLDLALFRVPGLAGSVEALQVELEARVPQSVAPSDVQSSLVASGIIRSTIDWRYELDGVQAQSSGEHRATITYGDFEANLLLDTMPAIKFDYQDIGSGELALTGNQSCAIELISLNSRCQLGQGLLSLSAEGVAADLELLDVTIQQKDEQLRVDGGVSISAFDLQSGTEFLVGTVSYSLDDQDLWLATQDFQVWQQATRLELRHQLDSGQGEYDVSIEGKLKPLSTAANFLADVDLSDVTQELTGRTKVVSQGSWQFVSDENLTLDHETRVELANFGIEYDGYIAEGGALQAQLSGWPGLTGLIHVQLASASAGVAAKQIETSFRLEADAESGAARIDGESLQLTTLGGRISSDQFHYDAVDGNGAALLQVDNLQLAELLALQRQDFSCAGSLSGSVPVQINAGKLVVKDAAIAAEAPGGFIRYEPDASVQAMGKQNEGLLVVLEAMRNFQYHTLSASVDYSDQGQMIARTSIKGANPDYQGGREVHLNLTVEENLKTLLESLRLGAEVAEKVGKKSAGGD